MRLAKKHRDGLSNLDVFGLADVVRVPSRFGMVETARIGEGDPIVLIPGLAGGWRLLAPLARALSRRFEVLLIGLRGDRQMFGPAGGQGVADHAADVAEAIANSGLERPTVMGVSFGAAVALELAVERPATVGSLIVSGVEGAFRPNLGTKILLSALEGFPLPRDSAFLNQFFNVLHGRRADPGPLADFLVSRCWETGQGVIASRLRGLEGFDLSDRLWEIEAPTLVLGGTRDVVIPASRQKALAGSIPGAQFEVIEGAGHVGFLTHRAEYAGRIGRFVREQCGAFSAI